MAIDFMDLASRYANARLDQAIRPFTDTEGYLNDRMQQNYGVDIYGNTRPKSTTIAYNDDGTQTITNKTEVAPQQQQGQPAYMPDETQAETQRLLAQNAAAAPQPAPMPAPVPQPMVQEQAMPSVQLPPPIEVGQPVQVAGPMVQPPPPAPAESATVPAPVAETPAPAGPVSPYAVAPPAAQPMGLRAPAPAPAAAPIVAPAAQAPMSIGAEPKAAPAPEPHVSDDFRNIYNNPNALAKYMGNDANSESGRKIAGQLLKIQLNGVDAEAKAQDVLTRMAQGDTKATNEVMRTLRKDEGSYIKAILFSRLGLNDLAKEEQDKLSTTKKVTRSILDGVNYTTFSNNKGAIVDAYDEDGVKVSDRTLSKLNASAQKVGSKNFTFGDTGVIPSSKAPVVLQKNAESGLPQYVHTTSGSDNKGNSWKAGDTYTGSETPTKPKVAVSAAQRIRDSKGTEWSVVPTPEGNEFYNDANGEKGRPIGRTVPIQGGTDLELIQSKADIETQAKFKQQSAAERLKAFENTNAKRADRDLPLKSFEEMGLNPDGSIIGENAPPAAPRPAPVAQQQAAPAPATAPRPTAQAAVAPVVAPVNPAAVPGTNLPPVSAAPRPATGGIPTASQMESQTKEEDLNRKLREEREKAIIATGEDLGKKKNAITMTLPATEQNATAVLNTMKDISTHPGLDKTIGNPDVLNKVLQAIPMGDRRDFKAKYDQLKGQEFLTAYNQLRGSGGISEKEGIEATKAIAALNDTGISPKEFKKNMWIFEDAVKTGIDNQRILIGQPPKYRGTPEQEQAKTWLREHPNDARAEGVRKALVGY